MVSLKFFSRKRRRERRRDYSSQYHGQPVVMKQLTRAYHRGGRPAHSKWLIKYGPPIAMAIMIAIAYSPIFRIRNVIINNIPFRQTEERLQATMQDYFTSRRGFIFPQSNLLFFRAESARQALSREIYSDKVVFERHWPNVLRINYNPENIIALWQTTGKLFAVDQRGIMVQELTGVKLYNVDLIVVDEVNTVDHKIGDQVAGQQLVDLLVNLPGAWGGSVGKYKIERVAVDTQFLPTVDIYTADGWYVMVSAEESIDKQMLVLKRLIDEKIKNDINRVQYIDVRFIQKASYSFKN